MFPRLPSTISAMILGTMLLGSMALGALAAPQTPPAGTQQTAPGFDRRPDPGKMRAFIKARLDRLSAQLALRESQQQAWTAFAGSMEALAEHPPSAPEKGADAATIAQLRADTAARIASKLALIAETTGKLQAVLDEGQRKTFSEAYSRFRRHGLRCGPHGGHGTREPYDDGVK